MQVLNISSNLNYCEIIGNEMRQTKAVINLNKNETYPSASIAAHGMNIRPDTLVSAIRTKSKCRGDYWMYVQDMTGSIAQELDRLANHRKTTLQNSIKSSFKKVCNLTTGQVYNSTRDADRAFGFRDGTVGSACNRKRPTKDGNFWAFITENFDPIAELDSLQESENQRKSVSLQGKSGRKVQCIETNQIFMTCREADQAFNLFDGASNRSAIRGCSARGYHFRFI